MQEEERERLTPSLDGSSCPQNPLKVAVASLSGFGNVSAEKLGLLIKDNSVQKASRTPHLD